MCDLETSRIFVEKSIFYKHTTPFEVTRNDEKPNMHPIYDKLYLKIGWRCIELTLFTIINSFIIGLNRSCHYAQSHSYSSRNSHTVQHL